MFSVLWPKPTAAFHTLAEGSLPYSHFYSMSITVYFITYILGDFPTQHTRRCSPLQYKKKVVVDVVRECTNDYLLDRRLLGLVEELVEDHVIFAATTTATRVHRDYEVGAYFSCAVTHVWF